MGREIEFKIPLTENEFMNIFRLITQKKDSTFFNSKDFTIQCPSLLIKQDSYFSRFNTKEERIANNEPVVIRLRTESELKIEDSILAAKNSSEIKNELELKKKGSFLSQKSFFTLKRKKIEDGIELNKEDETEIQDKSVLEDLFLSTGFHNWFTKTKNAFSCFCSLNKANALNFHLELEIVNNFLYVETEYTNDDIQADIVKAELESFIRKLGLNPEKKDTRSWKSILSEK